MKWIFVLGLVVLSVLSLNDDNWVRANAATSFTFAAAGDFGQNANTNASLIRLAASGASLFLALGDFSYRNGSSENHWCGIVRSHVGQNYPFELLAGNHEDGEEIRPPDGYIGNYTICMPNQIGPIVGDYGREYYFDYPAVNPLARFILISPGLSFSEPNGKSDFYNYDNGSSHYVWTASTIDGARSGSIPWVIVGMHKVCLSAGMFECHIGAYLSIRPDIIQLLIEKHVDVGCRVFIAFRTVPFGAVQGTRFHCQNHLHRTQVGNPQRVYAVANGLAQLGHRFEAGSRGAVKRDVEVPRRLLRKMRGNCLPGGLHLEQSRSLQHKRRRQERPTLPLRKWSHGLVT